VYLSQYGALHGISLVLRNKASNPDLHHTAAIRIAFNVVFCILFFLPISAEPRMPPAVHGFILPEGTGLPEHLHRHRNKVFRTESIQPTTQLHSLVLLLRVCLISVKNIRNEQQFYTF
jgi:hypothetical protein